MSRTSGFETWVGLCGRVIIFKADVNRRQLPPIPIEEPNFRIFLALLESFDSPILFIITSIRNCPALCPAWISFPHVSCDSPSLINFLFSHIGVEGMVFKERGKWLMSGISSVKFHYAYIYNVSKRFRSS